MPYSESELSNLVANVRRPFMTGGPPEATNRGRDGLWDHWRDVRFRRSVPWLPDNLEKLLGKNYAHRLGYRDNRPEEQVNKLTQRMGANPLQVAIHGRGDVGPMMKSKLESIEDWCRGAQEELDPYGIKDQRARRHQSGDGLAWFELEFLPSYVPPARRDENDKEYDSVVDQTRQDYGLPVCLNVPDPRGIYYLPTDLSKWPNLVVKVMDVQLADVKNNWSNEDIQLAYRGYEDNRLDVIRGAEMAPAIASSMEIGRMVRIVRVADSNYIYDLAYPNCITAGMNFEDTPGQTPNLIMLGKYINPLGRPPFYPMPARLTGDGDPAYATEPLAKELLDLTPMYNQTTTMRLMRAFIDAQKPWTFRPLTPENQAENTAPRQMPELKPGILEAEGVFGELPTIHVQDLDAFSRQLREDMASKDNSLSGAAQAGIIGRSTPAWTVQQFNEESAGFFIEPLDSRATAWRELMLDVIKVVRMKDGKYGKVYVNTSKRSKKNPEAGRVDLKVGLAGDDFNVPFRLSVSIESMTQSQRAANTEYGRRLYREDKVLSEESYIENYTPIDDPVQEQRRKDREALMRPDRPAAINLGRELARRQLLAAGYPQDLVTMTFGAAPAPMPGDEAEMVHNPGEEQGEPVMPGQGMSLTVPELPVRTPNQPNLNGATA